MLPSAFLDPAKKGRSDGSVGRSRAGRRIAPGSDMQTPADSRFGPQTVLPVQFHAERATCPERRLLLAVLEDALGIDVAWLRAQLGGPMPGTVALESPPITAVAS